MITIQTPGHVRRPKNADELLTIRVNDFGDNYHRLDGEPSSELERRVRKIRRRYKNIHEYRQAVLDYNEWMEYLVDIYGGEKRFKVYEKNDEIYHYIPNKPRLKMNKELKFYAKHGIVPSETRRNMRFDFTELFEFLGITPIEDDDTGEVSYEFSDEIEEMSQGVDVINSFELRDEIQPMLNTLVIKDRPEYGFSVESEMDLLDKYFTQKGLKKYTNKKFKKNKKKLKNSKTHDKYGNEIIRLRDLFDQNTNVKDTSEEDEDEAPIFYNGRFITHKQATEIKFYEHLAELGWNSYEIMRRKKYGKSSSKKGKKGKKSKELKAWKIHIKKKDKKKNKKTSKGMASLLSDIMVDNGYDDFEEYANEMANLTIDSIRSMR